MKDLSNVNLLYQIKDITDHHQNKINETGNGFNLISLLRMEHNERYTHSHIIAELLNPKGSHGSGDLFLKLFLEQVKIPAFQTDGCKILTEEYAGSVKCHDGSEIRTYLDIVIKEKSGRVILIENKIWARDQYLQIDRYYHAYKDKIIRLFYLNVNECSDRPYVDPGILSVFQNIAYRNEIISWLQKCLDHSHEKPLVYYQIEVYRQTLLKISNQNIYQEMNTEIKKKITESPANFESAKQIAEQYAAINSEITSTFFSTLKEILHDGELTTEYGTVKFIIAEDNDDPLYLGIQFYTDDVLNLHHEKFNAVMEILKNKFKDNMPKSNNSWNCWFSLSSNHLLSGSFLCSLDAERKLDLYKNMNAEVQKAVNEFRAILDELKFLLQLRETELN